MVPAALGGHLDHLIIARAAAALLPSAEIPIGFYEDRPYSAYLSPEQRREHMDNLVRGLAPTLVSPPVRESTQWLARICYPSQMTSYFTGAMALDRQTNDGEAVWFGAAGAPRWLLDGPTA